MFSNTWSYFNAFTTVELLYTLKLWIVCCSRMCMCACRNFLCHTLKYETLFVGITVLLIIKFSCNLYPYIYYVAVPYCYSCILSQGMVYTWDYWMITVRLWIIFICYSALLSYNWKHINTPTSQLLVCTYIHAYITCYTYSSSFVCNCIA